MEIMGRQVLLGALLLLSFNMQAMLIDAKKAHKQQGCNIDPGHDDGCALETDVCEVTDQTSANNACKAKPGKACTANDDCVTNAACDSTNGCVCESSTHVISPDGNGCQTTDVGAQKADDTAACLPVPKAKANKCIPNAICVGEKCKLLIGETCAMTPDAQPGNCVGSETTTKCDTNTCKCLNGEFTPKADNTNCLKKVKQSCSATAECVPHTVCEGAVGSELCECLPDFTPNDDKSACMVKPGEACGTGRDCVTNADCTKNVCVCDSAGHENSPDGNGCQTTDVGAQKADDTAACLPVPKAKANKCIPNAICVGEKCKLKIAIECGNEKFICVSTATCASGEKSGACTCPPGKISKDNIECVKDSSDGDGDGNGASGLKPSIGLIIFCSFIAILHLGVVGGRL